MPASTRHAPLRATPAPWPALLVTAMLALLVVAPATVHGVDATPAATTSTMITACEGVNVRTTASTTGTAKAKLPANTSVTVVATVAGSAYSTTCAGSVSGSQWVRISHVNGKTVSSLYGVTYVYGASKLFKAAPSGAAPATEDRFGSELTRLVNLDRKALGLAPMLVDPGLAAIARNAPFACPTNANLRPNGRAADLAARNYFAHTIKDCRKSDGTLYGAVEIVKTVFGYAGARSEILHWNSYASTASTYAIGCDINGANCKGGSTPTPYTVRVAQRSFMSSSVHRAAQLGAYERYGCGTATVSGTSKSFFACLFSNGDSTTSIAPAPSASPTPAPTPTSTVMLAACSGVNLRTSASTGATAKAKVAAGTPVTVNATVSGGSWSTVCGTASSGSKWYRLTHVNGKTVSSLYGVAYLYAATGVLKATPAAGTSATSPEPTAAPAATATPTATPTPSSSPTATPAPTPASTATPAPTPAGTPMAAKCAGVNLRSSSSTSATIRAKLTIGTPVTVNATVSGSSWSTVCGTSVSGSKWYRVTHINGKTVSSLYGVTYLYAATGVLKAAPTPAETPTPAPAGTPTPSPSPTPSPTPTPSPSPTPTPTPSPAPTAPPSPTPMPSPSPSPAPTGTTRVAACEGVNVRTTTSTSSTIKVKLAAGTPVTTVATVSGSSWSTVCGTSSSGSGWYRITHVNGQSVATLYGTTYLYAATGTLKTLPAAGTDGLTAIGASTTFYGRGWGHGVGLSQHGARGRALDGQDASTILAHYYPGTTFGGIAADTQVRVLVLDAWAATSGSPLTVYGRSGGWTVDGLAATFPSNARLRAIPTVAGSVTSWRLVINAPDGTILHDAPVSGSFRVRPADDAAQLQLLSKGSMYDHYRGVLRAILGTKVSVVNELPMDAYLRGVVPAEMPSSYPAEALKAQAVAARSYAAYRLRPSVGTFDVYDTTASQVYLGIKRETAATNAAIDATANQVLRSGSAVVNALFHSTGGGATEHNENVFTSATGAKTAGVVSYLRGSSDRRPDGTPYDGGSPYATWSTSALTQSQLSAIFGADTRTSVGTLRSLDLRNRGVSGRLVSVTLYGSSATKTVSGNVFVSVFNANRPAGSPLMRSSLTDVAPIP